MARSGLTLGTFAWEAGILLRAKIGHAVATAGVCWSAENQL
jgi:hypothetical protein